MDSYYDTKLYPDEEIVFFADLRGLSLEQEFYRHKAYVLLCIIKGKNDRRANEWAERIRSMCSLKYSLRKQIYWIIKKIFKENA